MSVVVSCSLAFSCVSWGGARTAYAEDIDTNPVPDEFQQQIEQTAANYDAALAKVDEANQQIEDNQARIDELEAEIPAQQKAADDAARELYKFQQQTFGIVDFILSSESIGDFISKVDYANRVARSNMDEINRLKSMRDELESTQVSLNQAKADADAEAQNADAALEAAKAARVEAQRKAREEAERQAQEEANAQAAAEAAAQAQAEATQAAQANSADGSTSDSSASDSSDTATFTGGSSSSSSSSDSSASSDDADWTSDEDAFVSEWASRINAYLAGSPMAGQGATFAEAAWTYGVDPRWSPAIAYTESSLGLYCFNPYNAWGWGSSSWSSWEDAIWSHVAGLARGYGYTLSYEAAAKYCPPNTSFWYNTTLAQMNKI